MKTTDSESTRPKQNVRGERHEKFSIAQKGKQVFSPKIVFKIPQRIRFSIQTAYSGDMYVGSDAVLIFNVH